MDRRGNTPTAFHRLKGRGNMTLRNHVRAPLWMACIIALLPCAARADFPEIFRVPAVLPDRSERLMSAYKKSFADLATKAEMGDVSVQYWLAERYQTGHGCNIDHAKAIHWYQQSVAQVPGESMRALLSLYVAGDKSVRDAAKAREWVARYRKMKNEFPCAQGSDARLIADDDVQAALCAVHRYWERYAMVLDGTTTADGEYRVDIALDLKQGATQIVQSNFPLEFQARAEKALIDTLGMVPVPKQLLENDGPIVFSYRYAVKKEGGRVQFRYLR
jgi:hypothetical protein